MVAAVIASTACSASAPMNASRGTDPGECPGLSGQPLFNGSATESYLGLGERQLAALVAIVDSDNIAEGEICTGTFVTANWVLTAAHCLSVSSPALRLPAPAPIVPVIRQVRHSRVDVALLQIDTPPDDAAIEASPIGVADASSVNLAVGDIVEMTGYGLNESRQTGELRFLLEAVTATDASAITVDGFGQGGGCRGDSGGPLLARGSDGEALIAGILSFGSATCRDDDTFVPLAPLRDWIASVVGALPTPDEDCGTLTEAGRCFSGSAVWCRDGALAHEACSLGKRCGWDTAHSGFRCVDPATDVCAGVDSAGACRQNAAVSCRDGQLVSDACGACQVCRIDGATGRPRCEAGP
jgi:hypothetical protein